MKDDDSIFGASPEGLERFMFEAWENAESPQEQPTIAARMLIEQPGGLIGRYKLISVLGEGGMGIVYLAQQESPVKRQVALKVIKPGMDSKCVLARFEAEQQALALMEHPHVARVYDAGLTLSGRPYFVMEHVKGIPITEYCDKHRLTIEERLQLFLHVCEAVQYAHQKGIIHRDIKPSNILVTSEDGQSSCKVIDFGIARAISEPLTERTFYTEQGQLIGTPEYMSPEQAELSNQDIDTRTDVYSLGVVLYELVAGVLPYDSQKLREHGIGGARKVICEQNPQTPSTRLSRSSVEESSDSAHRRSTDTRQLQRRLQGDLDWITLKSVEKDRSRRYASAGELAADIRRHLNNEPITAGRPSLAYSARKFVKRNRALVSSFAAVLVVLLAGIIVSLAFAVRANRARHEATVIAEFLHEDVFEAFDGWERGGKQITIKDFLDAASEKVSEKFGRMPLQEASIRKTLGSLYLKVNAFDEAESHLRRSEEIFTGQVGTNDARTMDVVELLGQMYWHRWQYPEAEKYLSEALPGKRRKLGDNNPNTLETIGWLGWACYGNGHPKKAEELLAEAYTKAQRALGNKNRITVECMLYYGCTLVLRGRYSDAKRVLADALRLSQGVLSSAHPFVVYPTALLGRLYSREGRYKEAEKLLSNALANSREAWGENSGGTYHNVAALAENYVRQGLIDYAENLMLEPVRMSDRTDESQNQSSIQNSTYLSFFYLWQKNYDDAEHWASEALRTSLESNGEGQPITFLPRMALGMVYRERGWHDEAETQLTKLLPVSECYVTDENVHLANTMHQLAALYQQQGKYSEAEKLHLRVLNIRSNLLIENHSHTLGTIRGLIALYTAWGKPEEARKWFSELKTAYAKQSAANQYIGAEGTFNYDPVTETYTLRAPELAPWAIETELDFSYPEPTSEIWHVCDDLHFAYKILDGDGSITARIESIDQANWQTKVGLMIRNALDPGSEHVAVLFMPMDGVVFRHRAKQLGATQSSHSDLDKITLPYWTRLTRKGNSFTAHHSNDGVNWHVIQDKKYDRTSSVEIPMGETVHIGLFIASHNAAHSANARISKVTVTDSDSSDCPFTVSEDISFNPIGPQKN
jgi:serine/threonine protein kinase/tetratricopeptide (TPR) repeat protein